MEPNEIDGVRVREIHPWGKVNFGKDTEIFVISVHVHLHTTIDRLDV